MAKKSEPDLLMLAFELVAERGWRRLSLAELARRAGVPLAQVYAELPDRAALLRRLGRRLDAGMLDLPPAELDGMTPRERVFELIMRRLDAMAPYKQGLRDARPRGAARSGPAGRRLLQPRPSGPLAARRRRDLGRPAAGRGRTARAGRDLRAGLQRLARRRHAGHGANAGRARPSAAAGGTAGGLGPRAAPRSRRAKRRGGSVVSGSTACLLDITIFN